MRRVLAGEVALYEVLMRRHNRRLYRAVRAILGGADDDAVLDAVQEAYVRAYAHLGSFEGRARFSTWLTRIAVYEALARRRRRRAERGTAAETSRDEETSMEPSTGAGGDPERRAAGAEVGRMIERAVDALPDNFRTVFVLRAVEELSVAETSACLGIPEETVKTRLHRARGMLQRALLAQAEAGTRDAFSFDGERCDRVVAAVLARIRALAPRGEGP